MNQETRNLYFFHFFLSISLTVVSSFLFIDQLFLRMGLSMSQFGVIKGLAFLAPVTLNLLLAPYLARLGQDREIVAISYLARVSVPYLFLLLPGFSKDSILLTAGCSIVFLSTMLFPIMARNSISALIRFHTPAKNLGRHLSNILSLWLVPGFILAIPCSWYIDLHSGGSDHEFYSAFFHVLFATTVFVLCAIWFILQVSPIRSTYCKLRRLGFQDIREPFQHRNYRVFLNASFMLSLVSTMIISFINPYLFNAQGLNMLQVSLISLTVSLLGLGLRPLWGSMCDQYGGKNILRVSVVGMAIGLFFLTGKGMVVVLIFAVLAWNSNQGVFGSGVLSASQYLNLSLCDEEKTNIYVAASSFVNGAGMFCGSLLGGFLLDWLAGQMDPDIPNSHYGIYFTYCALGYLVVGHFVTALRERRRRVSSSELILQMYRTLRFKMRR